MMGKGLLTLLTAFTCGPPPLLALPGAAAYVGVLHLCTYGAASGRLWNS